MKTLNIISREHLDKFWTQLEPLLATGLMKSQNELNIHQLRFMVVMGKAHVIAAVDNETDRIVGALALEFVDYPNFRAANIISIGGYDLLSDENDFEQLKTAVKKGGASRIEGWCSPAVARMWKSKFKFDTPYTMVTFSLEGE